jgi:predicted GNAT family acetyltransferase
MRMPDAQETRIEHVHDAFIVQRDGKRIAEMVYADTAPGEATIDHTWVSDELRGQGIARKLLDDLVAWARSSHTKIIAVCPYAKAQFDKDPSIRDVLA